MSENGTKKEEKNGNETNKDTKPKRDEKGRFLPGGPGGPGRGKKSDLSELSEGEVWEEVELLIRQDMTSKDAMTRQRAMKLKLMKDEYLLKKSAESKTELTAAELEFLKLIKVSKYFGGLEGLETMLKTCPGCNKFLGRPPRDFGFDKYYEDEG